MVFDRPGRHCRDNAEAVGVVRVLYLHQACNERLLRDAKSRSVYRPVNRILKGAQDEDVVMSFHQAEAVIVGKIRISLVDNQHAVNLSGDFRQFFGGYHGAGRGVWIGDEGHLCPASL